MKRVALSLIALVAISFTLLFTGCGQSGALYIPGDPSQIAVPPADESDSENEQPEDADPSTTE